MIKGTKKLYIPIFLTVILVSSCVMKSKYEQLNMSTQNLQDQLNTLKKENEKLNKSLEALTKENESLSLRNDELSTTNQKIVEKNKTLSDEIMEYRRKSMGLEKELIKKEEKLDELQSAHKNLAKSLKKEISEGNVKIQELKGMLKVNVVSEILFKSGSHNVSAEGKDVLEKVARSLSTINDRKIEIQGHTDNQKITGSLKSVYPSNWELSAARAITVVKLLQENKVDPEKLTAAGYGEYQPVATNKTPEGRQKNRRIEIILRPILEE